MNWECSSRQQIIYRGGAATIGSGGPPTRCTHGSLDLSADQSFCSGQTSRPLALRQNCCQCTGIRMASDRCEVPSGSGHSRLLTNGRIGSVLILSALTCIQLVSLHSIYNACTPSPACMASSRVAPARCTGKACQPLSAQMRSCWVGEPTHLPLPPAPHAQTSSPLPWCVFLVWGCHAGSPLRLARRQANRQYTVR